MNSASHRHSTGLSRRAQHRLAQAGASAYAWYDQELAGWLDPRGVLRGVNHTARYLAIVGYMAASVYIAWSDQLVVGVVAALVAGFVAWRTRLQKWHVTLPLSALVLSDTDVWTSPLAAPMLLAICVVCALAVGSARAIALMPLAVSWQMYVGVFSGHLDAWEAWGALGAGTALAGGVAWLVQGKQFPWGVGRISATQLSGALPPPTSRLPWLVRVIYTQAQTRKRLGGVARMLVKTSGGDPFRYTTSERSVPGHIRRKASGGYGERLTGLLLLALPRWRGIRIVHDVALPGGREANIDHIVVTRSAAYVVDSKKYSGRVGRDPQSGAVTHYPSTGAARPMDSLRTMSWAMDEVTKRLRVPVYGVMAIHGGQVDSGVTERAEATGMPIDVIPADRLRARILQTPPLLDGRGALVGGVVRWCAHVRASGLLRTFRAAAGGVVAVHSPLGSDVAVGGDWVAPASSLVAHGPSVRHSTARPPRGTAARPTVPVEAATPPQQHEPPTGRIRALWDEMGAATPARPGEVPVALHGISRGTPIECPATTATALRAMTGVCAGHDGQQQVWACSEKAWETHQRTHQPVFVHPVPAAGVAVREPGGVRG